MEAMRKQAQLEAASAPNMREIEMQAIHDLIQSRNLKIKEVDQNLKVQNRKHV